jgi:hypothetical protein
MSNMKMNYSKPAVQAIDMTPAWSVMQSVSITPSWSGTPIPETGGEQGDAR